MNSIPNPNQQPFPFADPEPFIKRFECWLLKEFPGLDRLVQNGRLEATDLIPEARAWVEELRCLAADGTLHFLTPPSALKLNCLLAFLQGRIERHYRDGGLNPGEVCLQLYPIDDLLVALTLIEDTSDPKHLEE